VLTYAGQDEHARFGHFFDGGADAFAAKARVFDAAIGHGVETPAWRVADDEGADFEFAIGGEDAAGIAREQAGLQTIARVIDVSEGLFEILVRLDKDYGAEDFFVANLHAGLGCGEDGGRDERAFAFATGDEFGAGRYGFLDPGLDALGITRSDKRADLGGFVGGVAGDEFACDFDELPEEGLEDATLNEDALHADAGLAGEAEGSVRDADCGFVEVGPIAVDDESSVAAQLEQDALAAGAGFEIPADLGGAGEADELDAVLLLGEPRGVGVGEGEDGEGFFGPSGLENDFAEGEGGEWRLRRGLEDERAACGEGGRNLVGDEVQGKIKGSDGEDRADGKALHNAPAIFVALGEIEWNGFAAETDGFFGSGFECQNRSIDLGAGEAKRLAGLRDDELGEAFVLLDERGGDVFEDLAALPAWKGAGAAQAGDGVIDGLARVGAGGDGDAADEPLVPRRADFEGFAFDPFLAAQQKSRLRARTHFHGAGFS
jgi:hypothetical protein